MERFDYKILKTFIPDIDIHSFLVFDNAFFSSGDRIVIIYRAPFEKIISIERSEYELKLLVDIRDFKIKELGI